MQSDSLRPGGDIGEIYELYGSMLFKIAMIHLGNKQDVEEALQETFFKLIDKAPHFNDSEHQKAWLIRVLTNQCKNMRGSLWRKRVTRLDDVQAYFVEPSDRALIDEVMSLPFKYKTVIHLYYYEGYSVKQIAHILQIGESAVKMRLARGRELLRMELEGENEA
ncbi:sigma-70 family RNA polymerase sigma factor [Paenibacillus campinasensis]|uniref:Sigma-70 family RNA polymerase sigma factor n=1 Tax=Paenibacillus campinasensis TaxID=66347 RepID=A0ABW9SXW2_9BACL|nr:sigma-70 family RNA polymerase sigma factor [Paenibacillus campinasensis]MUG65156.1 sigma-70 family RNA polymerase sigma factor [Paenibacillus campinasensis]